MLLVSECKDIIVYLDRRDHTSREKGGDVMKLAPDAKVHDLLSVYPFLKDYLIRLHPHFKKLNNPVLLHTVGRVATLNKAAEAAGIPVDEFISGIADEIKKQTGESVESNW